MIATRVSFRFADNSSNEAPILWVVSAMEIRNINPYYDPVPKKHSMLPRLVREPTP